MGWRHTLGQVGLWVFWMGLISVAANFMAGLFDISPTFAAALIVGATVIHYGVKLKELHALLHVEISELRIESARLQGWLDEKEIDDRVGPDDA